MGGCNQSKVGPAPAPAPADYISAGTIKNKNFSFWKFLKNRRNIIRVAPAVFEDQHTTAVSERTILATNKLPTPIRPRSGRDNSPSPTFSEESLSRYMVTEDMSDEMMELEAAVRPLTPDLSVIGNPLFAKKISKKKELHARQESQEILRQLRDAGIVARPESRAGGLSYEYFAKEEFGLLKKPPARLRKLKKVKKIREAKGDAQLRQEMESRMQMADERRKHVIDKVRIQQTQHIVLDLERARDISAQLEEEKILATAERLQEKEAMSQMIQGRATINRELRAMHQKHHHTEVRLRGVLKKIAKKDKESKQTRKAIVVSPIRGVKPDQSEDEEMTGAISN